jgi:prepilin-type N-terminal cleavage/methylation domain-containing protein
MKSDVQRGFTVQRDSRRFTSPRGARGFTLVELLVVIAIIAILAGLITAAAYNAVITARNTAIKSEINNIDLAFKNLSGDGGPPPDFSDSTLVQAYITARWPRHRYNATQLAAIVTDLAGPMGTAKMDQAEALVFWLGGFSLTSGTDKLTGFSADPLWPLGQPNGMGVWIRPTTRFTQVSAGSGFDLDTTKLTNSDSDTNWEYTPKFSKAPLVYFDSSRYAGTTNPPDNTMKYTPSGSLSGFARPYALTSVVSGMTTTVTYANPKSFQIISSGQDDDYGTTAVATPLVYPTGTGYSPGDMDNITNFCDRATLEGAIP